MISLHQLIRLQQPFQWKGGTTLFPRDMAFLIHQDQLSGAPDNEVIFNPLSLGDLVSGSCEYSAKPGATQFTLSPALRELMDAGSSTRPLDMPRLAIMLNMSRDPFAASKWKSALRDLANTDPGLATPANVTPTAQAQRNLLFKAGAIMDPDFVPSDDVDNAVPHVIPWVRVSAMTEYPPQHPTESQPSSLALTPELTSGSALMAQMNLAASLSPVAYVLASSGKVIEIPLVLISDVRYESPKTYQEPDDDQPVRTGEVSIIYSLTHEWASLPVIHVAHNREVAQSIYQGQPFIPYTGGNLRMTPIPLYLTSLDLYKFSRGTSNPSIKTAISRISLVRMAAGMSGSSAMDLPDHYVSPPIPEA